MSKVKICGITNIEDARAAVAAGADYIGLIFVKESPRSISFEAAKEIVHELDDRVSIVGVFKDNPPAEVDITVSSLGLSLVQYHGSETPECCAFTDETVIKAFELTESLTPDLIGKYIGHTNYILLDKAKNTTEDVGELLAKAIKATENHKELPPLFFAGGLSPDNVKKVVTMLKPFAVDVASGVESSPGKKDHEKIKRFCQTVKENSLCNH
jgi:phosphoribosylanthranilate isomerase